MRATERLANGMVAAALGGGEKNGTFLSVEYKYVFDVFCFFRCVSLCVFEYNKICFCVFCVLVFCSVCFVCFPLEMIFLYKGP